MQTEFERFFRYTDNLLTSVLNCIDRGDAVGALVKISMAVGAYEVFLENPELSPNAHAFATKNYPRYIKNKENLEKIVRMARQK